MLHELKYCYERKDLLLQLINSKLKLGKQQFVFGYLWWIIDPLLLMLIYWLLLGVIFKVGGPDYPLFVLCGIVPFRAITISFAQSTMSVSGKFSLISQIRFPRVFLPVSDVIANHVKLIFGFGVVMVVGLFYGNKLGLHLIYLALPLFIQITLVSGLAMINAVIGVFFADYKNLIQFISRILMYLSPVLYSIERIPEHLRDYYLLNPVAALIVMYREIIMNHSFVNHNLIIICSAEALLSLIIGYFLFTNKEKVLLKYI